ncbi:MFS transporter [Microbacterium aurantiacum]|nr:MFS transporter [Microbacterium aurantiacum]
MTDSPTSARDLGRAPATWALVTTVCLVAINMRPTITSVGPLLEQIGADTGLTAATLGFLGSVPLLVWAVVSPFALAVSRRFGMSATVFGALVLLAIGTVVRSLPGPVAALWLGTALIGVALALMNVLMPAVIKRDAPTRVPALMALYTALLGGAGAIASGVAVPVSNAGPTPDDWRLALAITGLAALPVAAGAWAWFRRNEPGRGIRSSRMPGRTGIWTDRVAWAVAGYMGVQATLFYMTLTWLAAISTSLGRSPVAAGVDVMVYQLVSIVSSLALPLVLRGRIRRWIPALLPVLAVIGVIGLMLQPAALSLWIVLIGLSSGASLSMALTLMADRARDHDQSTALSGMAQSVGYIIAAAGPVAFGLAYALTGGWLLSLGILLAVLLAQMIIGVAAGRDRHVLTPIP